MRNAENKIKRKAKRESEIYIATWNVRHKFTQMVLIKLTQIKDEYKISIMTIQESN